MVQDPRVTTLLSRLGGLYRDPARVDRDASSLLKSSVGVHLTPGIAPLVENNGDSSHCLLLQGTIAIVFRGMTYQLLVDIFLPGRYPIRPPVSYIRLAKNMYLKENHPHVGSDGMVYLPYIHEWNSRTHSLIEMVVAMSSVFSADPPCYSRSAPVSAPAAAYPPPPAYTASSNPDYISSTTNSSAESERFMREQIELIMAREAEEANKAAEVARRVAKEEEDRKRKAEAQKLWEENKTAETKEKVNKKINLYLTELAEKARRNAQSDWRDQQRMKQSKEKIEGELKYLKEAKEKFEQHIATVESKTGKIEQWLEASKESKQDEEISVDNVCQPASTLHAQMLDLSAENASLTDAMYFLDRGMYMGQMDCTTHLKTVRKLAKRQFLVRAHLLKINQVIQMNNR